MLDVLVTQHLDQHPQHRGGLGGHPLGVRGLRQPLAEPARDFGVAQLGLDDLRRHEVLPDEGAQTLSQLVFLAFDDRGVRDRYPQRVLEQRRHREPVGQRTDHAGLRGGGHVPDPRPGAVGLGPAADQEQNGGADQETQRDDLHSPQATAAFGVGGRVGAG